MNADLPSPSFGCGFHFTSVTVLQLWGCRFRSWRAMLDVVWAFPNLHSLNIYFVPPRMPILASSVDLSIVCQHTRACRNLTNLNICAFVKEEEASQALLRHHFGLLTTYYIYSLLRV